MRVRSVILMMGSLAVAIAGCGNEGWTEPGYEDSWDDSYGPTGGALLAIELESITGTVGGNELSPAAMIGNRGEMWGGSAHFVMSSSAAPPLPTTPAEEIEATFAEPSEPPELQVDLDVCPIEDFDGQLTDDLMEFAYLNVCVQGWCRVASGDELELEARDTPEGRRVIARVSWDSENEVAMQFRYTHTGEELSYPRY